ncbi:MAG: YraN family protein [Patescibacteria group bacterium]
MQNQSQRIGAIGEEVATNYLKKKGYKILARNFKTKWGELDIVAQKNKTIIFVEVKTLRVAPAYVNTSAGKQGRPSDFLPEDEITFHKVSQLQKMAQIYLSSKKQPLDVAQQIDIMAIEFNTLDDYVIRHTENAIGDY